MVKLSANANKRVLHFLAAEFSDALFLLMYLNLLNSLYMIVTETSAPIGQDY